MHRRNARYLLLAFAFAVWGCGGRVDDDAGDAAVPDVDAGHADPGGSLHLEECQLGFERGGDTTVPCNWTFDSRCYATKAEACACACPRRKASTCVSGFPSDDGMVEVSCF